MAEKLVKDSQGLAKELVNDCINRQAAIDALEKIDCSDGVGISSLKCDTVDDAVEAIEALPPAQPSSSRSHENDLISRWAVIRAVDKHTREDGTLDDDISCILEDLPPAQPERKRGRWLPDNRPGGGFWVCSCCKFPSEAFAADKLYKYCPVCGCRMDEGD